MSPTTSTNPAMPIPDTAAEVQNVTMADTRPFCGPPTPLPVLTRSARAHESSAGHVGSQSSPSRFHIREGRHCCRAFDAPPPYEEKMPLCSRDIEPATLAEYLFKFGFLFPPFWFLALFILASPLREPEPTPSFSWFPEKTEAERQQILSQMRVVEVKWALRCLWALVVSVLLGVAIGIAVSNRPGN